MCSFFSSLLPPIISEVYIYKSMRVEKEEGEKICETEKELINNTKRNKTFLAQFFVFLDKSISTSLCRNQRHLFEQLNMHLMVPLFILIADKIPSTINLWIYRPYPRIQFRQANIFLIRSHKPVNSSLHRQVFVYSLQFYLYFIFCRS